MTTYVRFSVNMVGSAFLVVSVMQTLLEFSDVALSYVSHKVLIY